MKIKMVVNKTGYPSEGEIIDVGDERAQRWVLDKGIAEFVDKKDRVTIAKKIEDAEKEAAKAEKELDKKIKEMEEV